MYKRRSGCGKQKQVESKRLFVFFVANGRFCIVVVLELLIDVVVAMNMGMPPMAGRGECERATTRQKRRLPTLAGMMLPMEAPNPLCVTYQNPAFPANLIRPENVLAYFCDPNNTTFYDRMSDNEFLRMQTQQSAGDTEALLA